MKEEEFFIFDDEDVIKSLRTGVNPYKDRIHRLPSTGSFAYIDSISEEQFIYFPSKKDEYGKSSSYSYEEITTSNGDVLIASIAEFTKDRSINIYRINGNKVTYDEYKAFLFKRREADILETLRRRQ